jgi:hypothetical protein
MPLRYRSLFIIGGRREELLFLFFLFFFFTFPLYGGFGV